MIVHILRISSFQQKRAAREMSTHLAQAYDWLEEALERAPDPAVFHPCEPSASLAFRAAVIKGDISRARSILQTAGRAALDVPRLPDVAHLVAGLRNPRF